MSLCTLGEINICQDESKPEFFMLANVMALRL